MSYWPGVKKPPRLVKRGPSRYAVYRDGVLWGYVQRRQHFSRAIWYWRTQTGPWTGPYKRQRDALVELLAKDRHA